jgi:hypothetical protein
MLLIPFPALSQTNLYWGDTHLHTSYSFDAYMWGNFFTDPDAAYRFASGLPVVHSGTGAKVQLHRPLDFLAVSDHDISFGLAAAYQDGLPELMTTERGRQWNQRMKDGDREGVYSEIQKGKAGAKGAKGKGKAGLAPLNDPGPADPPEARAAIWNKYVDAAERHNQPGKFTTLVAWEWTAMRNGNNLHRVVFTPAGGAKAKQFYPYSSQGTFRPEDLWNWLDTTSKQLGIDFVAIPHNSNLSAGLMFDMVDSDGRPITAEYARTRMRWEPVVEALQIKGNSETAPTLSPNDEFADFEIYNFLLVGGSTTPSDGGYLRTGLLRGLKLEAQTGVNPYKFGMEGATDSHTGLSSTEEDNFLGKSIADSNPETGPTKAISWWDGIGWDFAAEGITGVWAKANTRDEIAAAFKRKEVYATSGPRIQVRTFAGFDFAASDERARDLAEVGYRKGVPMGGDLYSAPKGKSPTFLIQTVKDPIGANLDRVQVVKGWLDAAGATHEKVFDVAWSGDRKAGANGKLPAVGNTVNLKTGQYTNSIGAAQFVKVWTDPEFDPAQRAFYYVRVLEIPTPRHSLYAALALNVDSSKTTKPTSIQERAYSSPVWYTPR